MMIMSKLPNSLPDEKTIKVVRKSFLVFVKSILLAIVLLVAPAVLYYVFLLAEPSLLDGQLSWPITVLGISAYVLFIWVFSFFLFLNYYLDVWIITDKRVIDIRQDGFFSRTISEQNIDRVQDITSEIKSVINTIFNYGNLYVQSAGEVERVVFRDIPDPEGVREVIMKLVEEHKKERNYETK